jgi:hypothetical protein
MFADKWTKLNQWPEFRVARQDTGNSDISVDQERVMADLTIMQELAISSAE